MPSANWRLFRLGLNVLIIRAANTAQLGHLIFINIAIPTKRHLGRHNEWSFNLK